MSDSDPVQQLPESGNLHEVTRILQAVAGDSEQMEALIPLLYDELRHIAHYRIGLERPGQTLQATALVHEAYLRLVHPDSHTWSNRRHFLNAASEAMRRILIDNARRKMALKRGGYPIRIELDVAEYLINRPHPDRLFELNEALEELEVSDPEAAEFVKLRFFAGLTIQEIANAMDISPRKANNLWAFAKSWLYRKLKK